MDDSLQKLLVLVEMGNFTKAAAELHISQPALSIAISKLERSLGAQLLHRNGRKLELTPAGKAVHESALDHQATERQLRTRLAQLSRKKPSVVVGAIDSVAATLWTTPAFNQLEQRADVTLTINNSRYLRDHVMRRSVDFAFVIDDGQEYPGLESRVVGHDQLWLVTHPSNTERLLGNMERGKLSGFISYDKPSTTYRHIHRFLVEANIQVQTRLYSTSPDIMLQMVLGGKGSAILPKALVESLVTSGQLSAIQTDIVRPISLVTTPDGQVAPAIDEFLDATVQLLLC